ncbi:Myc-type, basic helix-loop-helix (bHLH) domain [Dillenia turbinata]|uniref:Myc-type, basic helix-loop-helix (BHLH) domain n=1 Tax=Dillenia turbinata TaxID=194707 RepID=A0AAN8VCQ4_9MAGN
MDNNSNHPSSSSSKTDRKTIERIRRDQMKALCSKLNSLLPHQNRREAISLPDQLNEAANYIKSLQINLAKMKEKKDSLVGIDENSTSTRTLSTGNGRMRGLKTPHIEIHETECALEVVLITGLDSQFMFNETIRMLHEEGYEIINASSSVVNDTVFNTILSKVGESASSYGSAKISQRLMKFANEVNGL